VSQEPTDISVDALLRVLERHYIRHAARFFRSNGIPEPPRLPGPPARADVPPRQPDPARIQTYQDLMERRANPRKLVLMSRAIQFAGGTINCLICDISISGATLEITNPHDIPDRFNLVSKPDSTHTPCYVIWRGEERIGVAFD
jgi:PilZ domain